MIPKTGQWSNVVLGIGDPTRFSLLGGSNGVAGDVVQFGGGGGARFFPSSKAKILAAAGYSQDSGGGMNPGGGGTSTWSGRNPPKHAR